MKTVSHHKLLTAALMICDKNTVRTVIDSVFIEVRETHINLIATDGKVMLKVELQREFFHGMKDNTNFILPSVALSKALKIHGAKTTRLSNDPLLGLSLDDGSLSIPVPLYTYSPYANWQRVWKATDDYIGSERTNVIGLNLSDFKRMAGVVDTITGSRARYSPSKFYMHGTDSAMKLVVGISTVGELACINSIEFMIMPVKI